MKETEVNLEDVDKEMQEQKASSGNYFKPEDGVGYDVIFLDVKFVKKSFKEGDEPKLKAIGTLGTINGQPADGRTFETGSFDIIRELRNAKASGTLAQTKYRLKRKKEGSKTTYVFEPIGQITLANAGHGKEEQGAGAQAPASNDRTEAYV